MNIFYILACFSVVAITLYLIFKSTDECVEISKEQTDQLDKLREALANPEVQSVIERLLVDKPLSDPKNISEQRKKLKYDLLHAKLKCLVDDRQTRKHIYVLVGAKIDLL